VTIYTFPESLWKLASVTFPVMPISVSSPPSAFNPLQYQNSPTTELWNPSVQLTPLEADDWREVSALFRKLRGRRNKLRIFDPSRALRGAGAAGPTAQIAVDAAAGATSITIDGLTISQAVSLAADDLIGIGENLYAISDDAPSNGSGETTVSILPPLRQGVTDGDVVTLVNPTGLFLLRSGGEALTVRPGLISEPLSLDFIEAPDFD
jgi:hypothetical protein